MEEKNIFPYSIFQAQIDITNRCNLQCIHCRANANTLQKEIDYTTFIALIQELKKNWVKRLTLSWGEPFLHTDIYRMLDVLKEQKNDFDFIGITSNGYCYQEDFFEKIQKYKDFLHIQVSVDGGEYEHNKNRWRDNAFVCTIENIRKMLSVWMHVSTNITVNTYNIDGIEGIIDFLIALWVKHIALRHEIPSGRSNICVDFEFKKKYFQLLIKYFCKTKEEFWDITFYSSDPKRIMVDSEFLRWIPYEDIIKGRVIGGCSAWIMSVYVWPNGVLKVCPYINEDIWSLGENMKDIWNHSDIVKKYRNRWLLGGVCGVCRWKYICWWCRAVAKHTGDELGTDTFCLFWYDEEQVFKEYLQRYGVMDFIQEISQTKLPWSVFIPFWAQAIVRCTGKQKIDDFFVSSWTKRDRKEIMRKGYTYEVSQEEKDLVYFYKHMYFPYVLKRFHEKELIVIPYFFLFHLFQKDGKILFVIDKEKNRIWGYVLSKVEEQYYVAVCMGIHASRIHEKHNFISSALYFFLLDFALKNNFSQVSFWKTRVLKKDGVLQFKMKWGVSVLEHEKKWVYVVFNDWVNPKDMFFL